MQSDSAGSETVESHADPTQAGEANPSLRVVLGDHRLTAGIPGTGPLTDDQIQGWLDNALNHQILDVSLPMGLAAAENNIQGLKENPLTPAKIELGRQLYFDPRLSADGSISCASCHSPDAGYTKHTQFGVGIDGQTGARNSPVSYNRIISGAQFWDGRAADLEAQAIGPIENPIEMGNTHEACVATVQDINGYRMQFEKIFGGEVTIEKIGSAIAAFERTIVTGPTAFDYIEMVRNTESQWSEDLDELEEEEPELFKEYQEAKQLVDALDPSVLRGRDLFFSEKANCTACHAGANFTDELYHNLGVGMDAAEPDLGRYVETNADVDRGAFKTPTVRNVALTAPYMHDGSQATLEEVVDWYVQGGHPNPYLSEKIKKLDLSDQDKADLVAFMKDGLTGKFPTVETGRLPQ